MCANKLKDTGRQRFGNWSSKVPFLLMLSMIIIVHLVVFYIFSIVNKGADSKR